MENSKLAKKDYLFLGMTMLVLLLSCAITSGKKVFWNDELYSWHLLSDPSFFHMWEAFGDKINNTPPLYFLLGWFWGQVFSTTELSLRLFSSVGFCLALFLIWSSLRRSYSFWPVAMATITVFTTSSIFVIQNTEARMYGLFLAAAAACFFLYDRISQMEDPNRRILIFNFLAHAALINTHLHGTFYSGAILVCFMLYHVLFSSVQIKVYLSIILSWLTFLLYLPAFLIQADAGNPRSWIPEPVNSDLPDFLLSDTNFFKLKVVLIALLLLLMGQVLARKVNPAFPKTPGSGNGFRHLLIFAFAMMAVPIGVFLISRVFKPVFFPRYLIVTAIGYIIFLVHIFQALYPFSGDWLLIKPAWMRPRLRKVILFSSNLLLSFFVLGVLFLPLDSARKKTSEFEQRGHLIHDDQYPDLPIVIQSSSYFNEYFYNYTDQRHRYFYLLDEETASLWESGRFTYQEFKHLDALRRNYPDYFDGHIADSDDFLASHDRFLVYDWLTYDRVCPEEGPFGLEAAIKMVEISCPQWLEQKILNKPEYTYKPIADDGWMVLLLVERKQGSTVPLSQ